MSEFQPERRIVADYLQVWYVQQELKKSLYMSGKFKRAFKIFSSL